MTREEKKEKLTATLKDNYATKTGKDMELEDEVVGIYADVLLDEFGDRDDVTAEEVEAFFNTYSGIETEGTSGGENLEDNGGEGAENNGAENTDNNENQGNGENTDGSEDQGAQG